SSVLYLSVRGPLRSSPLPYTTLFRSDDRCGAPRAGRRGRRDRPVRVMRFLTASDRALLVETADLDEAIALTAAWADVEGVVELVPGARTVLVRFDPLIVSVDDLAEALRAVPLGATDAAPAGEIVIPVVYDGDDLADAAEL